VYVFIAGHQYAAQVSNVATGGVWTWSMPAACWQDPASGCTLSLGCGTYRVTVSAITGDGSDSINGPVTPALTIALAGDINLDGRVDVADYDIWAADVGMTGTPGTMWRFGDLNGDGKVDAADYDIWAAAVGAPTPGDLCMYGATSSAPTAVKMWDIYLMLYVIGQCQAGNGASFPLKIYGLAGGSSVTNADLVALFGMLGLPHPGDINGDGLVDVADYDIWAANVGATNATWAQGDLNLDGLVDVADYDIWAANVG
jgi:hypothetical protein